MDIRTVTEEDKKAYINKVKSFFEQLRNTLNTLEIDIESKDLQVQATAVWISGNLSNWFSDFVKQIRNIHTQKDEIQNQIMNIAQEIEKSD